MPGINQVTVGDTYGSTTPKAEILDVFTSTGGFFQIIGQAVVLQLQYGPRGSGARFTDEQVLGAGAFGTLPPGATGIRFRNLVAGSAATVTAYIGAGGKAPDQKANVWPEPVLAVSATGSVTTSGKAPTRTIVTAAGAGVYNTPANCVAILVELIGGGGAGAGIVALGAGQGGAGGGGGGGAYAATIIPSPAASFAFSVGAAGVAVGGGSGGNGGDSSFNNGQVLAKGGLGGATPPTFVPPVAGGQGGAGGSAGASVGQTVRQGGAGGSGITLSSTLANIGGKGGDSGAGGGGAPDIRTTGSGGSAGIGPGGGGGGAAQSGATAQTTGGAGSPGAMIVTEFY